MSDYSKTTDFAAKDALLSGNPAKIVKGTEIDTEFNNIATAVASKVDETSGVLTTPQINDTSADHQYIFAVSELGADRTVTLPLLTGNDEFVFKDHAVTLTNKSISLTSNTVTGTKAEFDTAVSDGNICFDGDAVTNLTMSTARLLGRTTASTGVVEEITVGTGLTLSGGSLSSTAGTGDVVGPGSATDNAVARFDSTTGKLIQNSAFIVDDTGHVTSFGGNIAFPATQAASAGANVLDDYEEGSWTPSLGGTATYTTQLGVYTKIGRVVYVEFDLVVNVIGTGSTSTITGLPFTVSGSSPAGGGTGFFFTGLAASIVNLTGYIAPSGTSIVMESLTAAAVTVSPNAVFGNGARIIFNGYFRV